MRIIACLSWFDEDPALLTDSVSALAGVADHLVAVDGAYALYPGAQAQSDPAQREAIEAAAQSIGIPATIHVPDTPWQGNEVEKRDFMFHLAEQHATANEDWYLVVDADEVVTDCCELHAALAACELDAGMVTLWGYMTAPKVQGAWPRSKVQSVGEYPLRKLFRAIPGLGVVGRHYHYRLPDGRYLWHELHSPDMAPAAEFAVRIHHRNPLRGRSRNEAREQYYAIRDRLAVEREAPDYSSYIAGLEAERAEHVRDGNVDRVRDVDAELAAVAGGGV